MVNLTFESYFLLAWCYVAAKGFDLLTNPVQRQMLFTWTSYLTNAPDMELYQKVDFVRIFISILMLSAIFAAIGVKPAKYFGIIGIFGILNTNIVVPCFVMSKMDYLNVGKEAIIVIIVLFLCLLDIIMDRLGVNQEQEKTIHEVKQTKTPVAGAHRQKRSSPH